MRDVFVVYCHQDQPFASGLARTLEAQGLQIGRSVEIWPHMRLVKTVDAGLIHCRHCVVIVSRDLLKLDHGREELDRLSIRRAVVALMYGVDETEVARQSPKLAVAAVSGQMADSLVRILRHDSGDGSNGRFSHG
jgi:hypothetical protein